MQPHSFTLQFTKMHGLGNDFIIVDALNAPVRLSTEHIVYLGDRHRGVGFDQLLMIEPTSHPQADVRYRIFNADGKEVQQCGNGARCIAAYLFRHHFLNHTKCRMETQRGIITAYLESADLIKVDMGCPSFDPHDLPIRLTRKAESGLYQLPLDSMGNTASDQHIVFDAVSMGNPHAILQVRSVAEAPVATIGAWLERHPVFPEGTNVEFVECRDPHTLSIRIFERGVGQTQACGSGACAVAASFIQRGLVQSPVKIDMLGGSLTISWAGNKEPLWMTGSATTVFTGECVLPS